MGGILPGDVRELNLMVGVLDPETAFECDKTLRSRSDLSRLALANHIATDGQTVLTKLEDQRDGTGT